MRSALGSLQDVQFRVQGLKSGISEVLDGKGRRQRINRPPEVHQPHRVHENAVWAFLRV